MSNAEVIVQRTGCLLRITLCRPQSLNSLTHAMVRSIDAALNIAVSDAGVHVLFLEGAGKRAFCAGGDVIALRESALGDHAQAIAFWREEYALDARIANFPKPVVTFMDGLVIGAGIGLAAHASHRLVTERVSCAMPEVGIGFVPDVGGTWLLSWSPGELGTHLALTGLGLGQADSIYAGFADVPVLSRARESLVHELASGGAVESVVDKYRVASGPATITAARDWIDAAYGHDDVISILCALRLRPETDAQAAAERIERHSPTSLAVTLAALRRARHMTSLEACLQQELAVSVACLGHPDFVEGVRAQLVDKDRRPKWRPSLLTEVTSQRVATFFRALEHD